MKHLTNPQKRKIIRLTGQLHDIQSKLYDLASALQDHKYDSQSEKIDTIAFNLDESIIALEHYEDWE
jgi:hypothetical protein